MAQPRNVRWYHYFILCGVIALLMGLVKLEISALGALSIAFGLIIMLGVAPKWLRSFSYALLWLHLFASFFALFSGNIIMTILAIPYMVASFAGIYLYKREKEIEKARELKRKGLI